MKIRIQSLRRQTITPGFTLVSVLASLLAGFFAVSIIFIAKGVNPFYALYKIFAGSFGSFYGFKETVTKAIPLILMGTGLVLAFKGKFWNIGAEGQLLMGATFATWIALNVGPQVPGYVAVPLMFLAGFIGGAILGAIPAILKVKFGTNEVISTLMLNYVAAEIVQLLVVGPWKGETQFGFPYTDDFPDSSVLGLLPGSRIHTATLVVALATAAILFIIIYRTRFGYEVRVIGDNPDAARYAGISFFKTLVITMVISGGIAGMAGVGEVAGIHHHLSYPYTISAGYGFTAIIVAWLARLNPLLAIVSGLFFAGIMVGGDAIQISLNLPAATVEVFNGVILFFLIMGEYFLNHKVRIVIHRTNRLTAGEDS
ncbi:MAG: ABC transporter permease [Spirochaetales bacterium]|jgi:general nucleoside transport system permease protein|nr:ABC transporter permease [Spirochaetales bacterium]